MPAIVLSIVVGFGLALGLAYVLAPDGSEPLVTGGALLALGLGWALMAWLTTRFSDQPQHWLYLPGAGLGGVGAVLVILQPGPGVMDFLGWVWPVALGILAVWMFLQLQRELYGFGRWLIGTLIAVLLLMAVSGGAVTVLAATTTKPEARLHAGQRARLLVRSWSGAGPEGVLRSDPRVRAVTARALRRVGRDLPSSHPGWSLDLPRAAEGSIDNAPTSWAPSSTPN